MRKTKNKKMTNGLVLLCACATAFSGNLHAQETKEKNFDDVVVTATKREALLYEVPFSVNVQDQRDIEITGADNLDDLSKNVAGLIVQDLGPGQSQVSIRGISAGQIVRDQPGVKEQVGVYLDESVISLSLFTPDIDLFDLNRVEVLRGPQGTLFGSGSVGGTIRYITNQPLLGAFEGMVEGDLNNISGGGSGGHVKGMINIPLADGKAALRAVAYNTEYGGYIDALGENGAKDEDVNDGTRSGGRVALTWQATDQLTITPRILHQKIESNGFNRQEVFNLYANPYTTTRPAITLDDREQYLLRGEGFVDEVTIYDVTTKLDMDPFALEYNASHTNRDILVSRDASALTGSVSVDLGYPDEAVLLPSNLRDTTDLKQDTHELRLSSNDEGKMRWVTGVFHSSAQRDYSQRLPTPGYDAFTDATLGAGTSDAVRNGFAGPDSPFNSDLSYDLTQTAVFGEVTYEVTDLLDFTVGGRYYDYEEKRTISTGGLFAAGDSNVRDETKANGFTPRLLASYALNDGVILNAQAAQGFRLGGVNDPLNVTLCEPQDLTTFGGFQTYDDETVWNYEVGMKSRLAGGIAFDAAVFYADISDLQVTLDAGSCSSRISFNVPEAHSVGLELELSATPAEGLEVSFAGSVVEAEFDSTVVDGSGAIVGGVEKGNRLPSVPDVQFTTSAMYSFPVSIAGATEAYVAGSYQYVGDRITQPGDQIDGAGNFVSNLPFGGASGQDITSLDLVLPSYEILNLSAGLVADDWEAVFYIKNVTDENALLSFDRERGGRARLGFRTNEPRKVGVTLRHRF